MVHAKKIGNIKKLKLIANTIRQDIIKMLTEAGSGHSAGPLGMADVFTALYFNILSHDPMNPNWQKRDILVLSNGHICPVRYATMSYAGYFPRKELMTLRRLGSRLQGHPYRLSLPGLETTSGPLGSGLSQACGVALALFMDNKPNRVYCVMSDGEHNEGNTWEAAMFASKYKLHNLIGIIDRNYIQIDGFTEDVMPLEHLRNKYEAFGWHVIEVDGHNIRHIIDGCNEAKVIRGRPTVIIAHTTPGKGVSFMENKYQWHGKPPTKAQSEIALAELKVRREMIMKGEI